MFTHFKINPENQLQFVSSNQRKETSSEDLLSRCLEGF